MDETFESRVALCNKMIGESGLSAFAGVGTLRRDLGPELGQSVELFRVLRTLLGGPGQGRLFWALGADVLHGMRFWSEKARACIQPGDTCDGLMVFIRHGWTEECLLECAGTVLGHVPEPGEVIMVPMPPELSMMSSHDCRKAVVKASQGDFKDVDAMLPFVSEFVLSSENLVTVYCDQVLNSPRATPTTSPAHDPAPNSSVGESDEDWESLPDVDG